MKKMTVVFTLLIFLALGFSQRDIQKTFQVSEGNTLVVDLDTGGSVSIRGWKKSKVDALIKIKGRNADEVEAKIHQKNGVIKVETEYLKKYKKNNIQVNLTVQIPQKFNVKLSTMGGNVEIEGVDGKIVGKTMGGGLKFHNLKGILEFKTMGGGILLKDSDVDGKVTTMGGRVLLENVVGDIDGKSMGGNVIYRNVKGRSGKSSGRSVTITTMGGAINLNEAPHGAKVKTMGGSIHIRSAAEFVKATTMGGDIDIDSVDGWVEATTMGGDVKVIMVGDPQKGKRTVTLSSMGGDISLTLPPGMSMDLDLEIAFTKKSARNYQIVSDFEIKEERTGEWDYTHGSPRKFIYGKGKVRGGDNRIKIKTINGNIYLKEGK